MLWSRYNILFPSPRFGFFLYNALSNTLLELDERHYRHLQQLRDDPQLSSADFDPDFISLLKQRHILVVEGQEEKLLMQLQHRRNAICYNNTSLNLTICPTLACNFRCSYCFETSQTSTAIMSAETVERLINSIRRYKEDSKHLRITWFGGEPTLAFDVMVNITEQLKRLDMSFEKVSMVTNGYLLDAAKIDVLNDLQIKIVQITLDGPQEIHDARRRHAGGRPTFQRILENIDLLMGSTYNGSCHIRVNIDQSNMDGYAALYASLGDRFRGKRVSVYPALVQNCPGNSRNRHCTLCAGGFAGFELDLYYKYGIVPRKGFFPDNNLINTCIANSYNGFVVGPEGELYKCSGDVGNQEMRIGSLYEDEPIRNPELVALYSVGADPFLDATCRQCALLPICGGGCVRKRLLTYHFGEEAQEFCTPYKEHMVARLEAYYDSFLTKDVWNRFDDNGGSSSQRKGYRVAQPIGEKTKR